MKIAIFGLSLSSSWGNGHATTYRALCRALHARGHEVVFLERDVPWYAAHRDFTSCDYCDLRLYSSLGDVDALRGEIEAADAVVLGSYVPEGVALAEKLLAFDVSPLAFYDIDTPVTLGKLSRGDHEYLTPDLVPRFDLYMSFSGGPALDTLTHEYGAVRARPLYCGVDVDHYRPLDVGKRWDLGYLGTYSPDRQPPLEALLIEPARRLPHMRFVVAGPQYPDDIAWPENVERIDHVGPADHPAFYSELRFALNVTRAEMVALGYSPSVRMFEAASCAAAIISDPWNGIETFFEPDREILLASTPEDVTSLLAGARVVDAAAVGAAGRRRILGDHSSARRAEQLEDWLAEARSRLSLTQARSAV
ncbi:CgeB family protein [Lutibaculum baratangense]|uniref:Spore protein YkvP/CgeB glycosyl transferase-like domain-containing protein n=1 Tax=Lutibaculum baratangense AMV1 TaxID=631454 RepID=V4RGL8_9HYPH|nr:glycosyltransferase [Lutibaculum baratangense]ESR25301.1 hypothetical protein N177_1818 [Lutibaculum baratangense AMV1]